MIPLQGISPYNGYNWLYKAYLRVKAIGMSKTRKKLVQVNFRNSMGYRYKTVKKVITRAIRKAYYARLHLTLWYDTCKVISNNPYIQISSWLDRDFSRPGK
jgi:hypothetical protein